jgi:hypothetical protein
LCGESGAWPGRERAAANAGGDEMLDFRKRAVVCQRLQLGGQFAGDLLDGFGVEDFDGLRERTERGAGATELFLYFLEFTGLLDAAQRRDDGIKEKQEGVGAVVVKFLLWHGLPTMPQQAESLAHNYGKIASTAPTAPASASAPVRLFSGG